MCHGLANTTPTLIQRANAGAGGIAFSIVDLFSTWKNYEVERSGNRHGWAREPKFSLHRCQRASIATRQSKVRRHERRHSLRQEPYLAPDTGDQPNPGGPRGN